MLGLQPRGSHALLRPAGTAWGKSLHLGSRRRRRRRKSSCCHLHCGGTKQLLNTASVAREACRDGEGEFPSILLAHILLAHNPPYRLVL